MIDTRAMIACLLGVSALARADNKSSEGWYGTYKLKDKKGYVSAIDIPRCDASAEEILDRWRGSLVIKYSKGAILVNDESWILDPVILPLCPGISAHRPLDPSIKGRIDVSFQLDRRERRGVAFLSCSYEDTKCKIAIAFTGDWIRS